MKLVLWLAKIIILGFWCGAVWFTLHPLPGKLSLLLPVFAVLVLLVHGIQAAIMTLVAKDVMPLRRWDYLSLLLFGFFAMLELRDRLLAASQSRPPKP
ncbi:DUF1145 domain-containing protein [Pseudaeromonas paramecii]|uniref:DUF1145 domain-containing protein n=1 Tax=Pseudaeromonas paramecii TaxID=2138166 RepID=A0ABP8Q267_9GAMM